MAAPRLACLRCCTSIHRSGHGPTGDAAAVGRCPGQRWQPPAGQLPHTVCSLPGGGTRLPLPLLPGLGLLTGSLGARDRAGGCQLTPVQDPRMGLGQCLPTGCCQIPELCCSAPPTTPALTSHCPTGPLDCAGACLPALQPSLVERCLCLSRMQRGGGHTPCPATAQLASYLALLCVVTLVALGAFPAVRELIIEQPLPIHLQREEGSQQQAFPTAKPPLPRRPRCSPAGSQGEQSRCRCSTP